MTAPDRARVTGLPWGFVALFDAAGPRLVDVTRVPPPTGFSGLRAVPA